MALWPLGGYGVMIDLGNSDQVAIGGSIRGPGHVIVRTLSYEERNHMTSHKVAFYNEFGIVP